MQNVQKLSLLNIDLIAGSPPLWHAASPAPPQQDFRDSQQVRASLSDKDETIERPRFQTNEFMQCRMISLLLIRPGVIEEIIRSVRAKLRAPHVIP